MDLYKFGWDRAKEQAEQNEDLYASIEGLSPEESALAIKQLEAEEQAEEDKEEHEHDREAEEESDYQDDETIYN